MTSSCWEIGRRIVEEEQRGQRKANYGEQLVEQLAGDLTSREQIREGFLQNQRFSDASVLPFFSRERQGELRVIMNGSALGEHRYPAVSRDCGFSMAWSSSNYISMSVSALAGPKTRQTCSRSSFLLHGKA